MLTTTTKAKSLILNEKIIIIIMIILIIIVVIISVNANFCKVRFFVYIATFKRFEVAFLMSQRMRTCTLE